MAQTYTFSQCIELLDIDAKVFRRWVREDLGLGEKDQVSRADSRVRYLLREQLEKLAELHDKILPADDQVVNDDYAPPGAYKLLADRMQEIEKSVEVVHSDIDAFSGDITHVEAQIGSLREMFEHPETGVDACLSTFERRIAGLEARTQPSPSDTGEHLAEREATYQQRIAELEAQLAAYQQQEKKPSAPAPPKKKPIRKKKRSTIKALPASLTARNAFAALHNISEKQVSKEALAGRIATTEGKWLSNGHVVTRALNQKGKHDFYEVFHERTEFQACDQCPHE